MLFGEQSGYELAYGCRFGTDPAYRYQLRSTVLAECKDTEDGGRQTEMVVRTCTFDSGAGTSRALSRSILSRGARGAVLPRSRVKRWLCSALDEKLLRKKLNAWTDTRTGNSGALSDICSDKSLHHQHMTTQLGL